MIRLICLTSVLLLSVGCTTSRQGKTLETIGYSAVACALIGSSSAPAGENSSAHAALWAGLCGTAAAIISNSMHDDADEVALLKKKNGELQTLITEIQNQNLKDVPEGTVQHGTNSFFERPPPKEFRDKIIPGKWFVYEEEIVRNEDGEKSVSIGKRFKIIPPRVKGEEK